jgi:hypothetical protein
MKYFPYVPNLKINGDGYLKGFLGLDWLPSSEAKSKVDSFEKKVGALLYGIWKSYTGYWVILEINLARDKQVQITPPEFAPDEIKQNTSGGDTNAKTGPKRGNYIDTAKAGTPGTTCSEEKKMVPGTGEGADTVIAFKPEAWGAPGVAGHEGPGSAADEILIHEIFHAVRDVRGITNRCYGSPNGWGDYEEFLAVTVCDVFSSETNRPLRAYHTNFQPLPADQATSAAFLAKYRKYLDPVRSDHPHLFTALQKAPGISFNPFALM